jgi:hypothetical protein
MKKAQSSFEFLATYGWAIFAALIIIGALMSFGFSNLRGQVPDSCYLGSDFICLGASADARGAVLIEFSPVEKFHVVKMICSFPDEISYEQDYSGEPLLLPNQNYIIGCENTTLGPYAGKEKVQVKIIYQLNETDALPRVADGEIVTTFKEAAIDLTQIDADLQAD